MFSKSQLSKMAPKRQATQEMFDDAVRENIDVFDMERSEAVESAIKDIELQGYSLDLVVTSGATKSDVDSHPARAALRALAETLDGSSGTSADDLAALAGVLRTLHESVLETTGDSPDEAPAPGDGRGGAQGKRGSDAAADGSDAGDGIRAARVASPPEETAALSGQPGGVPSPGTEGETAGHLRGGASGARRPTETPEPPPTTAPVSRRAAASRDALAALSDQGAGGVLARAAGRLNGTPEAIIVVGAVAAEVAPTEVGDPLQPAWIEAAAALGEATRALLAARHLQEEFAAADGGSALVSLLRHARSTGNLPELGADPGAGDGVSEATTEEGALGVAARARLSAGRDDDDDALSSPQSAFPLAHLAHVSPLLRALCAFGAGFEAGKVALVAAGAPAVAAAVAKDGGDAATVPAPMRPAGRPRPSSIAARGAGVSPSAAPPPVAGSATTSPSPPDASAALALAQREASAVAACRLLVVVTTADDETLPSSGAFAHARKIGKDEVPALARALAAAAAAGPGSARSAALANALRRLLATEELCTLAVEHGLADTTLLLLEVASAGERGVWDEVARGDETTSGRGEEPEHAHGSDADGSARGPRDADGAATRGGNGGGRAAPAPSASASRAVLRSHASLARALAASDAGKRALVAAGGLEALRSFLRSARAGDADGADADRVAAAALGALAGVFLRFPEAADRAADEANGALLDQVLATLRNALASGRAARAVRPRGGSGGGGAGGGAPPSAPDPSVSAPAAPSSATVPDAIRVGCTALRNASARSEKARAALLEKGAEPLLRATHAATPPGDARDAVAAAIRDLGLNI